jgi:hypothetical protein
MGKPRSVPNRKNESLFCFCREFHKLQEKSRVIRPSQVEAEVKAEEARGWRVEGRGKRSSLIGFIGSLASYPQQVKVRGWRLEAKGKAEAKVEVEGAGG